MFYRLRHLLFRGILCAGSALSFTLTADFSSGSMPQSSSTNSDIPQKDVLRVSEAFGHFIGRNLNSPGIKFDLESIIKGMREGAAGKPAPMSDKEYEEMMAILQEKAFNSLSESNLKSANDFLANNVKAEGVIEAKPGKLQYIILTQGDGAAVAPHTTPKLNYTGKYLDGTIFGSSEDANGPITVPLDQTIPGFSEGIVGMKEGEKRRLFVHPDLGYGTTGHLPPNSLLIFDIELVKADTHDQENSEDEEEDEDVLPLSLMDEREENASSQQN